MTAGDRLAKILLYYGLLEDETKSEGKIICPFHEDINPSLIYNLETGTWFCFGCGESGNEVDFLLHMMDAQKHETRYALGYLNYITHSKQTSKIDTVRRTIVKHDYEQEYMRAQDYYYGLKQTNWESNSSDSETLLIIDYMTKRGFDAHTLNKWGARLTYNDSYPLVFPIMDNDEYKGYVCRAINNPELESKRKYLYNYGFRRDTTLCGTYNEGKVTFIVEGYMDMLKVKSFGFNNVVAILGWKISLNQVQKLKDKNISKVVCCLDNDSAGRKGLKELCKHFNVLEFEYPVGVKDPGEMSYEDFKLCINKSSKVYRKEVK